MTSPADDANAIHAAALAADLRVVVGKLKRRLREQAPPGDLTWSQAAVLGRLERDGPATLSALARAENMRSQSMGAIVAPLEAAGLVSGTPDPEDGRQTILSVTPKTSDWIRTNRKTREDWLFQLIQMKLSSPEREVLEKAMELLKRIADAP
ncbi:MAG: winged helix DNA-binding protein [Azospirillaceae bacterium]|nr:winged helix DNA-binding protein [Azospirillaceae bacterium]